MNYDDLLSRVEFVCFGDYLGRVKIKKNIHNNPEITFDAHGLTVQEAKRVIRNIVNVSRSPIHLCIIHGFNRGTGIKDMLTKETFSGKLINRFCPDNNPGETILDLAS